MAMQVSLNNSNYPMYMYHNMLIVTTCYFQFLSAPATTTSYFLTSTQIHPQNLVHYYPLNSSFTIKRQCLWYGPGTLIEQNHPFPPTSATIANCFLKNNDFHSTILLLPLLLWNGEDLDTIMRSST